MIVFAVEVLPLSRPALGVLAGIALSPALLLLAVAFALFYLRLDLRFGIVMTALFALGLGAQALALLPTAQWLAIGIGAFVVGWIVQFVGTGSRGASPHSSTIWSA